MTQRRTLLHVLTRAGWQAANEAGWLGAEQLDRFGFVHCCTPAQLPGVLERWFPGQSALLAAELNPTALGAQLRWEAPELDDGPYPHVYGRIALAAVVSTRLAAEWLRTPQPPP